MNQMTWEEGKDRTPLLEVRDLSVDIPVAAGELHAVRKISFTVRSGETLCLVGESGCGKSMTALAVMNLLPQMARRSAGVLSFSRTDLLKLGERKMADIRGDRMAMIFQEPMTSLNPSYTIGNQLTEVLHRHRGAGRGEARERAVFLLEKVGIRAAESRMNQYPHQLSGGLRQRVMIAMALMCGPELIIADEPTTALDVTIQAQILHLLKDLQREFHMAMILITHDLGIVARVADRLAVMYAGHIVETGTTQEVFGNPLHPYTHGLLSCIPVPGKTKRGEFLGSIPGIVPTPIGKTLGCSFHNRCGLAEARCGGVDPEFCSISPDRGYRCSRGIDVLTRNAGTPHPSPSPVAGEAGDKGVEK
jgi:peptide/nickel transport system ATP-binding protein